MDASTLHEAAMSTWRPIFAATYVTRNRHNDVYRYLEEGPGGMRTDSAPQPVIAAPPSLRSTTRQDTPHTATGAVPSNGAHRLFARLTSKARAHGGKQGVDYVSRRADTRSTEAPTGVLVLHVAQNIPARMSTKNANDDYHL